MVTLEKIRTDLSELLKSDQELKSVEVYADTLEEALADAAVQLECKVINLDYEVLERGFNGFLGMAKKPWTIRAYQNAVAVAQTVSANAHELLSEEEIASQEEDLNKDGAYYVHRFGANIMLKVVLPVGEGKPVDAEAIVADVHRSDTISVDENKIRKFAVSGTNDDYEIVGTYNHNAAADAIFVIEVSEDEMKATATISAPLVGGSDITVSQIKKALKTQGVCAGISDEKITALVDNPTFDKPVVVAEAVVPVDGKDAYIEYHFETDRSKLRAKESATGQVNFKELNLVQNVVQGQPLAVKILPEKGKNGKTIFGRFLEATDGKDINLPLGRNVEVASDGRTIVAACNGQVFYFNGKINVDPVMEVDGVNIKTGNINFLGKVICRGSVEDGYDIKASGNIEITGSVGACHLESDGDIIVSQGIMGRDEGVITCGGTLWAKFIQNTKVTAGNSVVVSDLIMNSDISAQRKIALHGKKAQITGGNLFATELISAKNIGSTGGGAETLLSVGFDPKAKHRLEELQDTQASNVKELEELELNISTLENQQKIRRTLPKDKADALQELYKRRDEILLQNDDLNAEIGDIQQRLRELKAVGKVCASGTVYAGVKVYVRDEMEEVHADVKSVTFFYEDGFVRRGKYEEPDISDIRDPEGYA
ncbi:MAG: FapA family protein [Treponema sp.]|nr:FapA family protein [Treponema sp.]